MAKFKVGDRVRVVKNYDAAKPYLNKIGVIYDTINVGYLLQIDGIKLSIYFTDEMLELVEPKEDKPFNLNPHEFDENKNMSDVGRIVLYKKEQPKNRIPDRVVFNQDKGKVTVLISKHLDGVAPYWAYTSKVHGDDKYDAEFGFLLSYYKYLLRGLSGGVQNEMIDRLFKLAPSKRFSYLLGVVENEVLKIDGIKSYKDWQDIYMAICETPSSTNNVYNYTWDYAEWKEMLRVHELEIKREKARAVRKQIKLHEKEIAKLKKGV